MGTPNGIALQAQSSAPDILQPCSHPPEGQGNGHKLSFSNAKSTWPDFHKLDWIRAATNDYFENVLICRFFQIID